MEYSDYTIVQPNEANQYIDEFTTEDNMTIFVINLMDKRAITELINRLLELQEQGNTRVIHVKH
jgi:hypothetical protein